VTARKSFDTAWPFVDHGCWTALSGCGPAALFHDRFTSALLYSATSYAATEAANVSPLQTVYEYLERARILQGLKEDAQRAAKRRREASTVHRRVNARSLRDPRLDDHQLFSPHQDHGVPGNRHLVSAAWPDTSRRIYTNAGNAAGRVPESWRRVCIDRRPCSEQYTQPAAASVPPLAQFN
jgi:hypothetical protein